MIKTDVRIPKNLSNEIINLCQVIKVKKTNFMALAIEWMIKEESLILEEKYLIKRGKVGYITKDARFQFYIEEEQAETIERIALQYQVKPAIIYWYALEKYVDYMKG